jgi:uncharacterized membrane protein
MIENIINSGIIKELIVVIVAAMPIAELRGALPIAINLFHFPWYWALSLAVFGNLLPVPFLLLFFDGIARLVSKVNIGERFMDWVETHARRHSKKVERYETIGLALFVAVPLPLTGAWTGSIIAFLMGMRFSYALLSIAIGVLIAGIIVTVFCLLGYIGLENLTSYISLQHYAT